MKLQKDLLVSGRSLELKIRDEFPSQRKFCPFTKDEQKKYHDHHLDQIQEFIKQYAGHWIDEVFTPVVREKSIVLLSEFNNPEKKIAVDLLTEHVHETLDELPVIGRSFSLFTMNGTIRFFLSNERRLVL